MPTMETYTKHTWTLFNKFPDRCFQNDYDTGDLNWVISTHRMCFHRVLIIALCSHIEVILLSTMTSARRPNRKNTNSANSSVAKNY